jgi:23S rRNA (guanosine2251-2'-O)-methyltransferase
MLFYGVNPVIESLRSARRPQRIYLKQGKSNPAIETICRLAERNNVAVERVPNMEPLTQAREHQGVCAEIDDKALFVPFSSVLEAEQIVMLDGVQDPHNFGASLRVCEVLGFHNIIFQKDNSCGLTPAAIKASAGASFHVNLTHSRLNTAAKVLDDRKIPIFALDNNADHSIYSVELPEKFCVVVGSESKGVRFGIKRLDTTEMVKIPMHGRVDSLNLSCALSLSLGEFRRRLG